MDLKHQTIVGSERRVAHLLETGPVVIGMLAAPPTDAPAKEGG
jgi:hypothetical protein